MGEFYNDLTLEMLIAHDLTYLGSKMTPAQVTTFHSAIEEKTILHTYIHKFIQTYIPAYTIHIYIHTYVDSFITYVLTYIHTFIHTFQHTQYIHSCYRR